MRSFILLIIIFVSCGNLYAVNIEQNNLPNSPDLSTFAERHANIDFLTESNPLRIVSPEERGFFCVSVIGIVITGLALITPVAGSIISGVMYLISFGWQWSAENVFFGWLQSWILWTVFGATIVFVGAPLIVMGIILFLHYRQLSIAGQISAIEPSFDIGLKFRL